MLERGVTLTRGYHIIRFTLQHIIRSALTTHYPIRPSTHYPLTLQHIVRRPYNTDSDGNGSVDYKEFKQGFAALLLKSQCICSTGETRHVSCEVLSLEL